MLYLSDPDVTLHHGDALETLRELPDESVHCIATSPPFYALRNYGVAGQIGLEDTPEEWSARLVEVFREARRVLRKDGTLWIECGDSYVSGQGGRQSANGELPTTTRFDRKEAGDTGLKPKDLLGQPFLLAFALRADGWFWRGCYPWHKPNAMPESAKDRCTTAHSYVLHFSRSARYFFDGEAISEPADWERWGDQTTPKYNGTDTASGWVPNKARSELPGPGGGRREAPQDGFIKGGGWAGGPVPLWKHPRSVWTIPTAGFPEAHFATWPEALARRIILAGCPEGGTVLDPFGGSGTTALVARKLGRKTVLIELNADYCEMASRRLAQQSLLAEAL